MIKNREFILENLKSIHSEIRNAVLEASLKNSIDTLSQVVAEEGGDMIFAIDKVSEQVLLSKFEEFTKEISCVLIAEGLGSQGVRVLPEGISEDEAELRIIVDPIDGTRGLMYQKRSAWILTGVAPNRGATTSLKDIELAIQTEIPLIKQHLVDTLWAFKGEGCQGERLNIITGKKEPLKPSPSKADHIKQGFGTICRFFGGAQRELSEIEDELIETLLGPITPGDAKSFEDQYICTGGQLYELMIGHDRWIVDVRQLMDQKLKAQNRAIGLCCHPYDLCTELIAREAGVKVTDPQGNPPNAPLDVFTDVSWLGFANNRIQNQIYPALREILIRKGYLV